MITSLATFLHVYMHKKRHIIADAKREQTIKLKINEDNGMVIKSGDKI